MGHDPGGILNKKVVFLEVGLQVEALDRVSLHFLKDILQKKGKRASYIASRDPGVNLLGSDTTNCWAPLGNKFKSPEKPWAVFIKNMSSKKKQN